MLSQFDACVYCLKHSVFHSVLTAALADEHSGNLDIPAWDLIENLQIPPSIPYRLEAL